MDVVREGEDVLQYLAFRVGGHVHALGLLEIREIVEQAPLAPLPAACEVVVGLLNLRGQALPVLDLARILGLTAAPSTEGPGCILVVEAMVEGRTVAAGLLAEEVYQVMGVGAADFQDAPLSGKTGPCAQYVKALARVDENFIPCLNLERVLKAPGLLGSACLTS